MSKLRSGISVLLAALLVAATYSCAGSDASVQPANPANPANPAKTGPASAGMALAESSVEKQAMELISADKYEEARQLLLDATKGRSKQADAPALYLLALLEFNDADYKSAALDLERVRQIVESQPTGTSISLPWLLKRIGDCYLNLRDYPHATANYQAALINAKQSGGSRSLVARLTESTMSALMANGDYQSAVPFGQSLLQLAKARASSGQLSDVGDLVWAYFENLDLLRRMGAEKERLELRAEVAPLVVQLLRRRSALEAAGQLPTLSEFQKTSLPTYQSENQPHVAAEYLWLASDFKARTLPIIGWFPTNPSVRPTASILCVHGLGLENRAFTTFGQDMANRGFAVFAVDVRGFGSWQTVPSNETVQFDYALSDIGSFSAAIKQLYPNLPLFLLGESMGGGLALQAAARYGGDLAGVISSVPSPDRYDERRDTMKVAAHYLKGKHTNFDISQMVAKKAASNEQELDAWSNDPKAKMSMTPAELMQFDSFMRATKSACQKISTTPVFLIQGLKDKLVKPEGTQELFNEVATDNKFLLLVGDATHLIFENHNPDKFMLDTVGSWMAHHIPAPQQPR